MSWLRDVNKLRLICMPPVTKHLELCTKNKASCLQHVIGPETDLWEVGRGGGLALGNALFENHAILNCAENHWTHKHCPTGASDDAAPSTKSTIVLLRKNQVLLGRKC
jgi:hypothetical protein